VPNVLEKALEGHLEAFRETREERSGKNAVVGFPAADGVIRASHWYRDNEPSPSLEDSADFVSRSKWCIFSSWISIAPKAKMLKRGNRSHIRECFVIVGQSHRITTYLLDVRMLKRVGQDIDGVDCMTEASKMISQW
jgi:hypothetical protein